MPARKPTPPRKASGESVQEWQRGTILVGVRCPKPLAERARRVAKASGLTLAHMLGLGVSAVERMPPRPLTEAEEEREAAKGMHGPTTSTTA